jgi:hypothetical protein
MAEMLVGLYEEEGLCGPINEALRIAALEFNGVGKTPEVKKYARLALEAGMIWRGPRHDEVIEMKRLFDEPRAHWSWMVRKLLE